MANSETKTPKFQFKSPFGLHVTTYVGDVTDAVADAIVTGEDKMMKHESFVTKALIKLDPLFEIDREDMKKKHLTFPLWNVLTNRAKDQVVFHAFLSACPPSQTKQWAINMKRLYETLFQEAEKNDILVLALPLLGGGLSNLDDAVQVAVTSVATFKPKTLTDVLFVSMDELLVDQIAALCKFEFSGRPQSDKTKRSVSFKLDEEQHEKPRSRSKHKKSKFHRGGIRRGTRRGSESSIDSTGSDDHEWTRIRQNKENHSTNHRTGTRLSKGNRTNTQTGTRENNDNDNPWQIATRNGHDSELEKDYNPPKIHFGRGYLDTFEAYDFTNGDDTGETGAIRKPKKSRYSPASSDEEHRTDKPVVRPSMKGTRVSVDGKTYDLNMKYEGGPLLKSAEDVREKVIGPGKENKPSSETPRKEQAVSKPTKAVTNSTYKPSYKPLPPTTPSKVRQAKIPAGQKTVLPVKVDQLKLDEPDTPRRTKSSELGRTRKRSQSLAAKVEEEALELLRAQHELNKAKENVPAIHISTEEADLPQWTVGKGHSLTPEANPLSSQNRSSWSSDEEEVKPETQGVDCPMCSRVMKHPKTLDKCGHVFCSGCIDRHFASYKPVCPTCDMVYGVIIGNQPEGKMDVGLVDDRLPGYSKYDTIVITYRIPDGVQGPAHPDPGEPYKGVTRKAYLPNSTKGMGILRLLRTAFKRKLIFTIVRAASSDQSHVVTWGDIHHKTSMKGGTARFGYPDDTYLTRVKEDLARKGVTE
ncbi:probable E3 ubiquitin-protein ligase DTX2 [Haliotis cracherodii]|uniref:probable E3 ubiquitin-protein ligase DTX2 n=1 Tax=Haliotis cracherodii TaxID=6455 RepID=UPI0039EC3286